MSRNENLLRRVLLADAVACLASGVLMTAGAATLSPLLGLPVTLLLAAGLVLLPWAVLIFWLARRAHLPRKWVWAVITVNVLWVAGTVALLASGLVAPTPLGVGFVLTQALAVAALTGLQMPGLRSAGVPQAV